MKSLLTIAGFDPSSGAGLQADLRVFQDYGHHGLSVVTSITAQNSWGVADVFSLPKSQIARQIEVLLEDVEPDVIKIGLLGSMETAVLVQSFLKQIPHIPVVLDPVIKPSRGVDLNHDFNLRAWMESWIPFVHVLTPNLPEANGLLGEAFAPSDDMEKMAEKFLQWGVPRILLKGGHLQTEELSDLYVSSQNKQWWYHPRLSGEFHGTGCTLSSAMAACFAVHGDWLTASHEAQQYMQSVLKKSHRPGHSPIYYLKSIHS